MGFVSPALQHHFAADISVMETVASGFQAAIGVPRAPTGREFARAHATLRQLGLGRLVKRRWSELSFGEARLVLLARALVHRPRLLLLDEPCDGLSPVARARFLGRVERAARAGAQVIVAAHRKEDLPACMGRILRLHNGRIAAVA
jgi:ABC-type molybdenum transport system ATPase subunit/photorepair protein PhrA